jgi:hypothetical protein
LASSPPSSPPTRRGLYGTGSCPRPA